MNWKEAKEILNQAADKILISIDENQEASYKNALDEAWNRGVRAMKAQAILLFIEHDTKEEVKA